ncbi:hypothetical protein D4764_08G0005060 [Takifugu flavidus]|uniref:Uncharacterized protein n=1 Tax=Takifugu flavidus TaxID=433684 RepID=A0A5C6MP09_9TELE|nr:hypothetical protein D4764_08G0005060 [Takifugu flavidus]
MRTLSVRRSDGSLLSHILRAFPFLFGVNVMFCRVSGERPTENNRYSRLFVHLGNAGAVPVNVHHKPFQRRRGGFKRCQLCQSDN